METRAPPQAPCTYGTAWNKRQELLEQAEAGDPSGLYKSKRYEGVKKRLSEARRDFVQQAGWGIAVPKAIWPRLPDKSFRKWAPPMKWLSTSQLQTPPAVEYHEGLVEELGHDGFMSYMEHYGPPPHGARERGEQ